jgi:hypothetical protein
MEHSAGLRKIAGQLMASIVLEVNQPIAATVTNAQTDIVMPAPE